MLRKQINYTISLPKVIFSAFALVAICSNATADDNLGRVDSGFRIIDEVRLGLLAHAPDYSKRENGTVDVNGELLSSRLPSSFENPIARFFFTPRFHVGANVNTGGETSWAYTGLTWTIDIFDRAFLELGFGGSVHTGKLRPTIEDDRLRLGCRVQFRESASLGFRLTKNWSLMASAEHNSNAGLCDYNDGITAVGGRVGYTFN